MNQKLAAPFLSILLLACSPSEPETIAVSGDSIRQLANTSAGHWLAADTFYLHAEMNPQLNYFLISKNNLADNSTTSFSLKRSQLSREQGAKFGHLLETGQALSFANSIAKPAQMLAKTLIKGPLFIAGVNDEQQLISLTKVQTGNVIDDLFTRGATDADEVTDLGATITAQTTQFKLWAPTAKQVSVLLFNQDKTQHPLAEVALEQNQHTGVWQANIDESLLGSYYQFKVQVYHPASQKVETLITTDPYSLSLSVNSEYSQVTNLNHSSTKPKGWDSQTVPVVADVEDNVFYELHIRDFSASDNSIKTENVKGKYKAFAQSDSAGIKHLKTLKAAGLNNIHLLPTFDLGTVNEDTSQRLALTDTVAKLCTIIATHELCQQAENQQKTLAKILESYDANGAKAQQLVSQIRTFDDYNWGYDPFHYTVPEGSYAQNPEGNARIKEFREMVQNLHNLGFRVIMDVVYNHTHQAGMARTSVLDKIVPGYYQRLHPVTGLIEQSTCCDNTATERKMMAKLMTDSLVVWAEDYKIDGFRFDLMAHQPKAVMLAARAAVLAVDADSYFYGEGWNFGEVANNQRFVQASQLELGGSEIGTFTDRLRDAVRGAGMMASGDGIRKAQGIGNGLYTMPNELRTSADSQANYQLLADQLRVGLAGNLQHFPIENAAGEKVTGKDIPYGEQPTGYALDPADTINYVSKHDNQTLWDNNQYRNAFRLSIDDRVRMHALSLSYPLMAQGIPFIHMGSELLRSKSYLRDSYDYGDWFNKVDFSMQTNNYHVGLPAKEKDQQNWQLIGDIINNNAGRDRVSAEHIRFSRDRFLEFLQIRMSSKLFRLTTADAINQQVQFLNTGKDQQLGLIVMNLADSNTDSDTDNNTNTDKNTEQVEQHYEQIVVLFNSSAEPQHFAYQGAQGFSLHPLQLASADPLTAGNGVVKNSVGDNGFSVNKFSTAVFVKK